MKVQGVIELIKETETFKSGFQKRELVLITKDKYPQHLKIEFIQDKCEILNNYSKGDQVEININLQGRKWTNDKGEDVYFNSIQGWRIEKEETVEQAAAVTPSVDQKTDIGDEDDLPF